MGVPTHRLRRQQTIVERVDSPAPGTRDPILQSADGIHAYVAMDHASGLENQLNEQPPLKRRVERISQPTFRSSLLLGEQLAPSYPAQATLDCDQLVILPPEPHQFSCMYEVPV